MICINNKQWPYYKSALPLLIGCATVFLFFSQSVMTLRTPDSIKSQAIKIFGENAKPELLQNMRMEGFRRTGTGIELASGAKGLCSWKVVKEKGQGCLMRISLYGAAEHPSTLSVSLDNGATYNVIAGPGNYIGEVINISRQAEDSAVLLFRLVAENTAIYPVVITDQLAIYIGENRAVSPNFPDLVLPGVVFLCAYFLAFAILNRHAGIKAVGYRLLFCCIIFAAFVFRWHEVMRLAGTALDSDAQGYFNFARNMELFSANGFYSARFGMREPMYLLIANFFLTIFGPSETHLRFVSCFFSILAVALTWQFGKKWLSEPVGLLAAAVMAVHPYLIELSARGLREEFITCLLLVLMNFSQNSLANFDKARTLLTGFIIGALLLTRSEMLPLILAVMVCLLIFEKKAWTWPKVLVAVCIGIVLLLPYLYSTYRQYGNAFYAVNEHARFYTNIEFAGRPGFPTREEIAIKGPYTGQPITPFEYYFKLHTPLELITKSAIGLCKTTFAMPFSFAYGKGYQKNILAAGACLKNSTALTEAPGCFNWVTILSLKDIADYVVALFLTSALISGIYLLLRGRHFFICSCIVTLQLHLLFIASFGIDQRLTAHIYPVLTICCAYALYCATVHSLIFTNIKSHLSHLSQNRFQFGQHF